jgi:ribosomal-protein-alanine N-acetyltransferase
MLDNKEDVSIRWMIKKDLGQVLNIEETNSTLSSPAGQWQKEDFNAILRERNNIGIVAIADDCIIGFCIYNLQGDKIHIFNMATENNDDVAERFLDKLKSKLFRGRRTMLEIDVRESDLRAQLFFKSQGFLAIEVIRDYYELPRQEDAYKFRYTIMEKKCKQ